MKAKRQYRTKIESYYNGFNSRRGGRACKLLQTTKGSTAVSCPVTTRQAELLLCAFKASNTEACMRAPAVPDDCVIKLSVADVSMSDKQVNIHKAGGPNGLPGRILRTCTDQLTSVFTDIFNLSLTESVIVTYFKQTIIVHVPKNTKVTCLND
jgi:hypothetical protein